MFATIFIIICYAAVLLNMVIHSANKNLAKKQEDRELRQELKDYYG